MKLKLIVAVAMVLIGVQAGGAQDLHLRFWQGHWDGGNLKITRQVPVTELRTVEHEYTIKVPVIEIRAVPDPRDSTKTIERKVVVHRLETRTRTITVPVVSDVERVETVSRDDAKNLKLQRVSGDTIDTSDLAEVFSKPTTVIELPHDAELSAAQRALLRPEAIISVAGKSPDKGPPPISDEASATIDELRMSIEALSSKIDLLQSQLTGGPVPMPLPPDVPPPPDAIQPAAP